MAREIDLDWHVEDFDRNGYTILENVVPHHFVDRVIDTLVRLEGESGMGAGKPVTGAPGSPRALFERGSSRVRNLVGRDPVFEEAAVFPPMLAFIERVLGQNFLMSTGMQSFTLNARSDSANPGDQEQAIHTDDDFFPVRRPHMPLSCQVLWALSDFTEQNGATRVVPGSHRWEDAPKFQSYRSDTASPALEEASAAPIETVPALMPKGSIYIHHTSLWHGAGADHTEERRYCLGLTYCPGWVRPFENIQLYLPREKLRSFGPELQSLLGIRGRYAGVVGGIDHRDPWDMIFS